MWRQSLVLFCQSLLSALLIGSLLSSVSAQTKDSAATSLSERLKTRISLEAGTPPLAELLATLSKQTGMTIQAESYLNSRTVFSQFDGISIRAVLDALAELNDWTWRDTGDNKILITRRRLRFPTEAAAVPRRIQASIPKDIRTFLKIPQPNADLTQYFSPIALVQTDTVENVKQHTFMLLNQVKAELIASLKPTEINGEPLRYKEMDALRQKNLLTILIFTNFEQVPYALLQSDLPPYAMNPASALLQLEGGTTLHVRTIIEDARRRTKIGFGTQVKMGNGEEKNP